MLPLITLYFSVQLFYLELGQLCPGVVEGEPVQGEALHQAALDLHAVNKGIRTLLDFASFSLTPDYLQYIEKV